MGTTLRTVAESKHEEVQTASPTDTVAAAVKKMADRGIGALVVVGNDRRIAGIISERDILNRVVAENRDPNTTTVADVMTPDPACVEASTTVEEAMRKISEQRIRHLPLVSSDKLVNMISSGDLMAWMVKAQRAEIQSVSDKLRVTVTKNKVIMILAVIFVVLAIFGMLTS